MLAELLQSLLCASEKAANIARACRREPELFELLVEEKTFQDFKTLADVLIQETVRHDVSQRFPVIAENIFGEESNTFTNTLGETVTVAVQGTEAETTQLLTKVLNDNKVAASLLSKHIHETVSLDSLRTVQPVGLPADLLSVDDVGVWIDPIDATSQYIKGGEEDVEEGHPPTKGLQVVTVLIGVYSLATGVPCIGVVNQPFNTVTPNIHWGVTLPGFKLSSIRADYVKERAKPRLLIGWTEDQQNISPDISDHFHVIRARGAGHKLLMVALGMCEVYVNTAGTTYKWDTCSPHAILTSREGGLLDYKHRGDVLYNVELSTDKANADGIIAYTDRKYCDLLLSIINKANTQ